MNTVNESRCILKVLDVSYTPRNIDDWEEINECYEQLLFDHFAARFLLFPIELDKFGHALAKTYEKFHDASDFVQTFIGKWDGDDCKLYRFTVKQTALDEVYSYLKMATCLADKDLSHLWIETDPEEQQDKYLYNALTGECFDSCSFLDEDLTPKYAVDISESGKWKKTPVVDSDYSHIYLMLKCEKSLRDIIYGCPTPSTESVLRHLSLIAEHLAELHERDIVHGNVSMRHAYFSNTKHGQKVFQASERYIVTEKVSTDPRRRKYFSKEQREAVTDVDKSSDVFSFGLVVFESLCRPEQVHKNKITKSIRQCTVYKEIEQFEEFQPYKESLGGLLCSMLASQRENRPTMKEVVEKLKLECENLPTL